MTTATTRRPAEEIKHAVAQKGRQANRNSRKATQVSVRWLNRLYRLADSIDARFRTDGSPRSKRRAVR